MSADIGEKGDGLKIAGAVSRSMPFALQILAAVFVIGCYGAVLGRDRGGVESVRFVVPSLVALDLRCWAVLRLLSFEPKVRRIELDLRELVLVDRAGLTALTSTFVQVRAARVDLSIIVTEPRLHALLTGRGLPVVGEAERPSPARRVAR